MTMKKRVLLVGVGGQGTLTATKLLGQIALDHSIPCIAGEIHGMAQRGGVVESTLIIGYHSPRIGPGQADILLGFEPLETLRALCSLRPGGLVVSNSDPVPPIGVTCGKENYPDMDRIKSATRNAAGKAKFIPCITLASQAGSVQSANMVLISALLASGELPFGLDELKDAVRKHLKPKLVDMNLKAIELGAQAFMQA
jgi:indolepyruvate ferredoxin oxidoreductase, beta subunit